MAARNTTSKKPTSKPKPVEKLIETKKVTLNKIIVRMGQGLNTNKIRAAFLDADDHASAVYRSVSEQVMSGRTSFSVSGDVIRCETDCGELHYFSKKALLALAKEVESMEA